MLPRDFAALTPSLQAAAERRFGRLKARCARFLVVSEGMAYAQWGGRQELFWA